MVVNANNSRSKEQMNKRRKHFCSSRRDKSSDRRYPTVKVTKTFSILSDNLLQYLTELHDLFQIELDKQEKKFYSNTTGQNLTTINGEEDDLGNHLQLLKKRFLREITGKELSCLSDIRTALIWETMLPQFNVKDFSLLLSRQCFTSSDNIYSLLLNKVGSRTFEQLMTRCLFLCHQERTLKEGSETIPVQDEKLDEGLDKFWKEFVASICSDSVRFLTALCDCNASHVLRSFLLGAVGFMKDGRVIAETEILRGAQRLQNCNSYFASLVESLWNMIDNCYQRITQMQYLSHVHASLVLQSLLFTKVLVPSRRSSFFHQLYNLIMDRKGNNKNNFRKLACHAVTSHLLEAFVYCLEDDLFQELFGVHLRNEIPELLYDKYGNHVLQQIIKRQKDIPKVLDIFDKLEPQIDHLISVGHFGVLSALAESLIPCEVTTQKSYVRKIAKALNCVGKTSYDLVRNLLYPSETARAQFAQLADSIPEGNEISQSSIMDDFWQKVPKCSSLGSFLIQCLLRFSASARQLVEESFVSFGKTQLLLIALDPSGSRAVESFLSLCENFSLLTRFIDKFTGLYAFLAKDCNGFHVLSRMYAVTDVKGKRKLVEELAVARLWLVSFPYGNQALFRFKVYEFVRRQEQWAQKETTMENRKRLFKDILENDFSESEISQVKRQREAPRDIEVHRSKNNNENESEESAQMELILGCIRNLTK